MWDLLVWVCVIFVGASGNFCCGIGIFAPCGILIWAYSIILVVASRIFRLWHVEPFIVSIWDLHCGMWNLHRSMHDLLVVTCRIFYLGHERPLYLQHVRSF